MATRTSISTSSRTGTPVIHNTPISLSDRPNPFLNTNDQAIVEDKAIIDNSIFISSINNTGIVPPDLMAELPAVLPTLTMPIVAPVSENIVVQPFASTPLTTSLNTIQNSTENSNNQALTVQPINTASVLSSKNAGKWLLGLLVAGFAYHRLTKKKIKKVTI